MASSSRRICRSSLAKSLNFSLRAAAIARLPTHLENGLHYWLQAALLATDNLRVLPVPKSRNRVSHSFSIQAPCLLFSKALPRLDCVYDRALALLHLDRIDPPAIHPVSIGGPNAPAPAFARALFFPNKGVQPSNGELPILTPEVSNRRPTMSDMAETEITDRVGASSGVRGCSIRLA